MVGSKQLTTVWLSPEEADRVRFPVALGCYRLISVKHCVAGASVWKFASTDEGVNPDVYVYSCSSSLLLTVGQCPCWNRNRGYL